MHRVSSFCVGSDVAASIMDIHACHTCSVCNCTKGVENCEYCISAALLGALVCAKPACSCLPASHALAAARCMACCALSCIWCCHCADPLGFGAAAVVALHTTALGALCTAVDHLTGPRHLGLLLCLPLIAKTTLRGAHVCDLQTVCPMVAANRVRIRLVVLRAQHARVGACNIT